MRRQIGTLLIQAGCISEEQLDKALEVQKVSGKRLGEALIELKFISEEELYQTLAIQFGLSYVDLNKRALEPSVVNLISKTLAEKHNILPHPAYFLGFPRLSCRSCIFFTPDHWATLKDVAPEVIDMIHEVEEDLQFTLDNKYTIGEMVKLGKTKLTDENRKYVKLAVEDWKDSIITNTWQLPAGAFGTGGGSL